MSEALGWVPVRAAALLACAVLALLGYTLRGRLAAWHGRPRPFNRATRAWVYTLAREGRPPALIPVRTAPGAGRIVFVRHAQGAPHPDLQSSPPLAIGAGWCDRPFLARSLVNVSAMSYGAISRPAIQALSHGAAIAGCWVDTGEGGLASAHLEGGCDLVMQIGATRYGVSQADGNFSPERARALAARVKAFEIKLSEARPGMGTALPGGTLLPDMAAARGIGPAGDWNRPEVVHALPGTTELLDQVASLRGLTGRPVGIKAAMPDGWLLDDIAENVLRRGLEYAPDFLVVDGADADAFGATGNLSTAEALPRAVDVLIASGLKERIRLVASGGLVTSMHAAWALAVGADFVNTGRGFMLALGCQQALRCHSNTCPSGIATHDARRQRPLRVEPKHLRVANYAMGMNRDIERIAHECGLGHARLLRRQHCRVLQPDGDVVSLSSLHPYPRSRAAPLLPAPLEAGAE